MLWYFRISRSATVPGRYLCGLFCGTGSPAGCRAESVPMRCTRRRNARDGRENSRWTLLPPDLLFRAIATDFLTRDAPFFCAVFAGMATTADGGRQRPARGRGYRGSANEHTLRASLAREGGRANWHVATSSGSCCRQRQGAGVGDTAGDELGSIIRWLGAQCLPRKPPLKSRLWHARPLIYAKKKCGWAGGGEEAGGRCQPQTPGQAKF